MGRIFRFTSVCIVSRNKSQRVYPQEAQLVMSLKFHFCETLSKVPLDSALDAMKNAWESCQDEADDDKTLVCSRETLERSLWN